MEFCKLSKESIYVASATNVDWKYSWKCCKSHDINPLAQQEDGPNFIRWSKSKMDLQWTLNSRVSRDVKNSSNTFSINFQGEPLSETPLRDPSPLDLEKLHMHTHKTVFTLPMDLHLDLQPSRVSRVSRDVKNSSNTFSINFLQIIYFRFLHACLCKPQILFESFDYTLGNREMCWSLLIFYCHSPMPPCYLLSI